MKAPKGLGAWMAKVGEKGQIVIPKEAREMFGISPGDTLLILGDLKRGLAIINGEKMAALAGRMLNGALGQDMAEEEGDETDEGDRDKKPDQEV